MNALPVTHSNQTWHKLLLVCGIASSLLYVATVFFAATRWEGYDSNAQAISELIAIDSPTRPLLVVLFALYALLIFTFGMGVWQAAAGSLALRLTAVGLIGKEILGLVVTLFFPIHLRGVAATPSDTMHAILTMVGLLFMLLAMISAATAFGTRFRLYTLATVVVFIVFGVLSAMQVSQIDANLPMPWLGFMERINIYADMLWVVVLAVMLLRQLRDARFDLRNRV